MSMKLMWVVCHKWNVINEFIVKFTSYKISFVMSSAFNINYHKMYTRIQLERFLLHSFFCLTNLYIVFPNCVEIMKLSSCF